MGSLHNIFKLELKSKLVAEMKNIRDNTAQVEMWNTIKDYVTSNLKLTGVYTGTIPGTPPTPDPANGPHIWSVLDIPGQPILNSPNYATWVLQLRSNFTGTTFNPTSDDTIITATTPVMLIPSFNLIQSGFKGKVGDFEKEMEELAGAIVDGILADPIAPRSGAAVSTNGGVGNVIFFSSKPILEAD